MGEPINETNRLVETKEKFQKEQWNIENYERYGFYVKKRRLKYPAQQVQVVPSFVRYCKKTFHQNRLFSQFGMDIFEVRRELNTMFPELF